MKQYINKDKVYVENLGEHEDQVVSLFGWLYNKRGKGKIAFLLLRDGTGIVQCVMSKADVGEEIFSRANDIPQESAIKITGKVNSDERAPGGYEIHVTDFEIVSLAEEYPITPKEHGTTFLMDHRHLWLRSKKQHAILRIRHTIVKAIRDFFDGEGFTLIDAPIFTPAACEGTSTLFETDYFDNKAYLTQSGQLYMEAGAMAFGKVYCFGPTFRAEKSKTRRHLTEFWMVEPEVAYMDLNGDMELAENFVSYIVKCVLDKNRKELEVIERDISKLETIKAPFPRLHYDEAAEILKKENTEFIYGDDFGALDETVISSQFDRPVMVHRYPAAVKAFYMKEDPEDRSRALGFDMLAPEGYGEVIGGGQREDDLTILLNKIKAHELPEEAFNWYLDLRRYGTVPHAGFGLGIERTVAWLCGLHHVRETIPFARLMHRLTP
ncbi:MAG: asparagine--tRNA ligase [Deferribacteres bacterium]|nr:asparagine--tRNA ligase [candidate division KSB1 bacterium]MCB9501227.1 asparagine--tRNA ligase [Deferribacteres bacterium]